MWSRGALGAGHELFFQTLNNHITAAAYAVKGDSFVAEEPRMWSEQQLGGTVGGGKNIDLAPNGKRIAALMTRRRGQGRARGSESRRLPLELLRRTAAQSAGREIASHAANRGTPSQASH